MHMYLYLYLLHKLAHGDNQAAKLLDQPQLSFLPLLPLKGVANDAEAGGRGRRVGKGVWWHSCHLTATIQSVFCNWIHVWNPSVVDNFILGPILNTNYSCWDTRAHTRTHTHSCTPTHTHAELPPWARPNATANQAELPLPPLPSVHSHCRRCICCGN